MDSDFQIYQQKKIFLKVGNKVNKTLSIDVILMSLLQYLDIVLDMRIGKQLLGGAL